MQINVGFKIMNVFAKINVSKGLASHRDQVCLHVILLSCLLAKDYFSIKPTV